MSPSFPKSRFLREPVLILATIGVFLFSGITTASAIVITDQSGTTLDLDLPVPLPGDGTGFEFTTPGYAFTLELIRGSWSALAGYSGPTSFQLFESSGSTLTPVSTPISVTVPITTLATFDFVVDSTVLNFTSQSLDLTANTTYVVMGINNGSGGSFGMYVNNGGDPDPAAQYAYDPVGPLPVAKFPAFDPAYVITGSPIPEPGSVFLVLAGALLFLRRRRS